MLRKIIVTATGLSAIVLLSITSGQAATCNPGQIVSLQMEESSPNPATTSKYKVRVTCPKFTGERVYWLSSGLGSSGYATLLTAVALDKNIYMDMTDYPAGSLVTKLQLVK